MYYTVYKITNKVNGKIYIGKHQTLDLDDGYFGSGKVLKRAIKKHGIENFIKEYIEIFDNEDDMNLLESKLVNPTFVANSSTYNLKLGGTGGFDFINKNGMQIPRLKIISKDELIKMGLDGANALWSKIKSNSEFKEIYYENRRQSVVKRTKPVKGKAHTEESKRKIGEANKKYIGERNSQYGTCWITNGIENKKIKKDDLDFWEKLGYSQGRKIN